MKFFVPVLLFFSTLLSAADKPNVVFILVDDLGWADLGCYGSSNYKTPNLDKFASTALRFTDAYAGGSVCSPTRAAILTGKSPARLKITDWIPGYRSQKGMLLGPKIHNELPHKEVTIAEALKAKGYKTAFVGKWHLGGEGFFPENQGFDINVGGHHKGSPPGGYYSPYKNPKLSDGPKGEYLPDRLTDECIKFIEKEKDSKSPFFLYLCYYTVHTPIQASNRHIADYKDKLDKINSKVIDEKYGKTRGVQNNAAYASMVTAMDENVGRLIQRIDELGLGKNTIIIFTSDNGGLSTLKNPGPTCNLPLRAGKGWCYEGGIRVPLIIRAPEVTKPGSESAVPVTSMDFFPTILELTGNELQPEVHVDGKSLTNLMKNNDAPKRDYLVWHYPHYHGSMWRPGAAIRSGKWKMIEFFETGEKELYDLEDDLGELKNLASSYPEKVKELTAKMAQWRKQNDAEMPKPNPAYKK